VTWLAARGGAAVFAGALASLGCSGLEATLTRVDDVEIRAFASRIESFYTGLEGLPLDTALTFEDRALRAYFADPREFSDYYASIAEQVREARMRHAAPKRVEIVEFRFDRPDLARVEVQLRGDHMRGLVPWDVEVLRSDTWRQVGGTWYVTPEKF
jgi:hypothetical protein